jgi:AcrR family transcriptional regulator
VATDDVLQRRDLHPGWTRDEVMAAVRNLRKAHASAHGPVDEGLRERKKRLTREQISDVATLMFCERGFDNVRIAEIAAAVGVSEKTVYNYFPTKESLVLDRADELEDELRQAIRERPTGSSPADAVERMLELELEHYVLAGALVQPMMLEFGRLIETTPALLAAMRDLMARLTDVAAEELAREAGVDPHDPEPQIAARAVVAIWDVHMVTRRRHILAGLTGTELQDAVRRDIRRVAAIVSGGLSSWNPAG